MLNGNGRKPKGMHWRTFQRLQAEHNAFVAASLAGIAQKFGLVNRRLDGLGLALEDLTGVAESVSQKSVSGQGV